MDHFASVLSSSITAYFDIIQNGTPNPSPFIPMLDRQHLDAWLDGLPDPSTAYALDHDPLDFGQSDFVDSLPKLNRPGHWIAIAPVNKLPNEIIVEILTLANPDPPSDTALPPVRTKEPSVIGPSSWLPLMLVCHHWHAVIYSNPCFWRAVNAHRNLHHFWFALLQTRKATFEIAIHHHKVCAYLRLALVLLEGPFPALQELMVLRDFLSPEACRSTPWIELPKKRFPVLSTLRLSGVGISWNLSLVSRLRRLELSDCAHGGPKVSPNGFLDILEACQDLEELRLHNFLSTACSDRSLTALRTVHLPKLKNFGFRDDVPLVLNVLCFPPKARLHVGSQLEILDEDELNNPDMAKFDFSARVEVNDGVMRLVYTLDDAYVILDFNVELAGWTNWAPLLPCAVRGFLNIFTEGQPRRLEIVGATRHFTRQWHHDLLDGNLMIDSLRIEGCREEDDDGELRHVFHGLTDVIDVSSEVDIFVFCPHLKSLSLSRLGWARDSMEMIRHSLRLRQRYGSVLEELSLELFFPGVDSDEAFQAFKAPLYAELCELVPGGIVTMTRVV
ncbi:hypothetical protein VTO73DRAFT_3944 [Trametes versicolor]